MCSGAWGGPAARIGEKLRRALDLEHWPAFQRSFERMMQLLRDVASGAEGHGRRRRSRWSAATSTTRTSMEVSLGRFVDQQQPRPPARLLAVPQPARPRRAARRRGHQDAGRRGRAAGRWHGWPGCERAVGALALPRGPDVRQLDRHHRAGRPPGGGRRSTGAEPGEDADSLQPLHTACWLTAPRVRRSGAHRVRPRADAVRRARAACSTGAPNRSSRPPKATAQTANQPQPSASPATTSETQCRSSRTRLQATATASPDRQRRRARSAHAPAAAARPAAPAPRRTPPPSTSGRWGRRARASPPPGRSRAGPGR